MLYPTEPSSPMSDTAEPPHLLRAALADLPPGLPAVLMLGTGLTLVGSYTGTVELIGTDNAPSTVGAQIMIAECICPDPRTDVDPGCARCFPRSPAELVALVARAVRASRDCPDRAGVGLHVEGCDDLDVSVAEAVLAVLFNPGRHGVFSDAPSWPPAVLPVS